MEGYVKISAFMQHLERNDLVIAPRHLVDGRAKVEKRRAQVLRKTMISFREIADAELWGAEIKPDAVRAYALKHAKKNELVQIKKGQRHEYKIIRAAVERIAKAKGTWHSIAE